MTKETDPTNGLLDKLKTELEYHKGKIRSEEAVLKIFDEKDESPPPPLTINSLQITDPFVATPQEQEEIKQGLRLNAMSRIRDHGEKVISLTQQIEALKKLLKANDTKEK